MRTWTLILVAGLALAGCDDAVGPGGNGPEVGIQFGLASSAAAAPGGAGLMSALRSTSIVGTNGTLILDTAHVIVAEFELERSEAAETACEDDDSGNGSDDGCEEFDAGPAFLNLPLESGVTTAATATVPPGVYDELEFEVEDLEDDEENAVERQRISDLLATIRSQFPDWPREASLRVVGTFTPTGGAPRPFVAYFEAEIEVELEFATPFVVTEDDVSRTITVELAPSLWFTRGDGTVLDLSAYDFGSTGRVVEFEVEMEHGFERVEHDDD